MEEAEWGGHFCVGTTRCQADMRWGWAQADMKQHLTAKRTVAVCPGNLDGAGVMEEMVTYLPRRHVRSREKMRWFSQERIKQ